MHPDCSRYLKIRKTTFFFFFANDFWSPGFEVCLMLKLRSCKGQSREDPTVWKLCTDSVLFPCHHASSDFTVWASHCVSRVASDVCRLTAIRDKEVEREEVTTDTWMTRNTCLQRQTVWYNSEVMEKKGNKTEVRKSARFSDRKEKTLNIIAWSVTDDWIHPFFSHNCPWALSLSHTQWLAHTQTHTHTIHTAVTSQGCQSDIGLPRIVSRPVNLPEAP